MDEWIKKLLNEVRDDVKEIKTETTKNTVVLEDHIRRTELLEDWVKDSPGRIRLWIGVVATLIGIAVIIYKTGS